MSTEQTSAVVRRRLEVIRTGDVAAIMQDYTEESTIYTPDGPVKGLEAIRAFLMASSPIHLPKFPASKYCVRTTTASSSIFSGTAKSLR